MPVTYSLSVGLVTEAQRKGDITTVLLKLPDNTQKLIAPKDVRDAFVTSWATSAFKQTIGPAQIEYIGIDSGNPSNRDIKQKILIGKRANSTTDIMTNNLLNSDTDIFFYNTKPDSSLTQSVTRISVLAGTNSSLHIKAPYLQSETINGGQAMMLSIVNPSTVAGPININSTNGRVSINGITFPTVAETAASASNNRMLRYFGTYPNGTLKWVEPTFTLTDIGIAGTTTKFFGTVSVNGYPLEFIEPRPVPQSVGGISAGRTFAKGTYWNGTSYQNWPLVEVLRELLYAYTPPTLSIDFINPITGNNWAEVGVTSSLNFTYSIALFSNDVYNYRIKGTTYSGLSFFGDPGDVLLETFTYATYSAIPATTKYFVLEAADQTGLLTFSHSATASIIFVSPIFASSSTTAVNVLTATTLQIDNIINQGDKNITPYLNVGQSIQVSYNVSSEYIYLITPFSYPVFSQILDFNSVNQKSSFTWSSSARTPSGSPVDYGTYRIYRTINTQTYNNSYNFIF